MSNSSQISKPVTITAKRARYHGYRSIFKKAGAVLTVQPHDKQPIVVRSVEAFNASEVVIRDSRGKRRPVSLSTIKSLEVEASFAEKIKPLPSGDDCAA
jgi:hypothetical protein